MQDPPVIAIGMADQADIDATCANASVGEAAVIYFYGDLVAVANEYGTITTVPGREWQIEKLEQLTELATEIWPKPASRVPYASDERGWVILERWIESNTVNIHGPWNHQPYEDTVHRIVLDLFGTADLAGCKPPKPSSGGVYYSAADLPDHVELVAVQLGEPFQL